MRKHAGWMTIADERILEFLHEESARQPKQIAEEMTERGLDFNDKYIGRRCLELANYGLLQNLGNGIYSITEPGEKYLDGELNANELESRE